MVFVHQPKNEPEVIAPASLVEQTTVPLHRTVYPKRADRYLTYFFTSFLPSNVFTSRNSPITGDLLAMSKSSPALRDAIDAVAALHFQRQWQMPFVKHDGHEHPEALKSYMRSVRSVREEIAAGTFIANQSALWVTFFLGLFEVCMISVGKYLWLIPES